MKTLIVFNHPFDGSFCNAILKSAIEGLEKTGHAYDVINLDKDGFDPVMRSKDLLAFVTAGKDKEKALAAIDPIILKYKAMLEEAEQLVMIFPIWWMTMPAMAKGFIDKVIFPAVAYDMSGGALVSRLYKLKKVTLISTMNTPSEVYKTHFNNSLEGSLIKGTFNQIGIRNVEWINLDMVRQVGQERRTEWLMQIRDIFANTK